MSGRDDLLTVPEVADIVRLHKVTVYRKARAGEFGEKVKQGRKVLIPRRAVDEYVDQHTISATAEISAPPRSASPAVSGAPARNPRRTYRT